MSEFVNTVDIVGDEALTNSIIDRSIVELSDNVITGIGDYGLSRCGALTAVDLPAVTSLGGYAFECCSLLETVKLPSMTKLGESYSSTFLFQLCDKLKTIDAPNITEIGKGVFSMSGLTSAAFPLVTVLGRDAFESCSKLEFADFPLVTSIPVNAFKGCKKLTTVNFPVATTVGNSAFSGCSDLVAIDFPSMTGISGSQVFYNCSKLTALILRSETMATLSKTNAFDGTPIISGTGYIYVPAALVDSYKAATNWSTYAAQFRALENYTVDGTITGALDETKI